MILEWKGGHYTRKEAGLAGLQMNQPNLCRLGEDQGAPRQQRVGKFEGSELGGEHRVQGGIASSRPVTNALCSQVTPTASGPRAA